VDTLPNLCIGGVLTLYSLWRTLGLDGGRGGAIAVCARAWMRHPTGKTFQLPSAPTSSRPAGPSHPDLPALPGSEIPHLPIAPSGASPTGQSDHLPSPPTRFSNRGISAVAIPAGALPTDEIRQLLPGETFQSVSADMDEKLQSELCHNCQPPLS
jgi:hypothetical protein